MNGTEAPKTAKSLQTQTRIMQEFLGLIAGQYWEKITVKQVCAAAGITRSTFYQYFSDIYDLMGQIEEQPLSELAAFYEDAGRTVRPAKPLTVFDRDFDCSAPRALRFWFEYCGSHRDRMRVLLGENSDPYFIVKVRGILEQYVNHMMDGDGMPRDELRSHFTKAFVELHLMTARTWLSSTEESVLSVEEIIHVLGTMRIGANYMSFHERKGDAG